GPRRVKAVLLPDLSGAGVPQLVRVPVGDVFGLRPLLVPPLDGVGDRAGVGRRGVARTRPLPRAPFAAVLLGGLHLALAFLALPGPELRHAGRGGEQVRSRVSLQVPADDLLTPRADGDDAAVAVVRRLVTAQRSLVAARP